MNLRLVIALLLIPVFIVSLACSNSRDSKFKSNKAEAIKFDVVENVVAPDFTVKDVTTDETINLSSYEGSVVLLNFVNYGCSPSIDSMASRQLLDIKKIYNQRSNFIPLSVFCGCCPEEVLRDFTEENIFIWP